MTLDADDLARLNDPRLEPLLRAGAAGAEHEIEKLIVEKAQPLIAAVLARHSRSRTGLTPEDANDIAATINLRLLTKLRGVARYADDAIQDVEKYVATLTYNAINDHLRRAFPARARLKNRLRYALTHDARLALWSSEGTLVCGLGALRDSPTRLSEVPIDSARAPKVVLNRDRPADALAAIFAHVGHPVEFEAIVAFAADVWHVTDVQSAGGGLAGSPSAIGTADHLEMREYVRALWSEIRQLRPMQRKALLLNLRSGETVNVISLVVLTGIAPFDEVAATLEMAPEDLAEIWNSLPLDDLRIAAMLDVSRQKVINLRKSARDRLARRMPR